MAFVTLKQLLEGAAKGGYGLGGFNVNDMEQVQGIMEAAADTKSPVILQASRGARKYAGDRFLYHLAVAATETYPDIPVVLHQDHGSVEACLTAVDLGFTSVMIDGSLKADGKTPSSFEENVEVTKKVVEYAHEKGVSVEAELGVIGGIEDGHGIGEGPFGSAQGGGGLLTDPDQAVEFVEMTKVDALAVAVGTSHGAYKFSKKPDRALLAMDRIIEIHKRIPNVPLVMHGSSSVPQELQDVVNKFGGKIKQTWGVPIEEIQLGIKNGVGKINVDTDTRLAMTGAIRKYFAEKPEEFDPRYYMMEGRNYIKEIVKQRMIDFGQAGHAGDFVPIPLEKMKESYQ